MVGSLEEFKIMLKGEYYNRAKDIMLKYNMGEGDVENILAIMWENGFIDGKHSVKDVKKSEEKIPHTMDAQIWAREFCETYEKINGREIDFNWMIGWFANSIMAGFDEACRRHEREENWVYVLKDWQNGVVVALYSREPTKEQCDKDYELYLGIDLEWEVPKVIYKSGQDSSWNCILERRKVDSPNRITESINIKDLKPYND
jgi:hypothetical protein